MLPPKRLTRLMTLGTRRPPLPNPCCSAQRLRRSGLWGELASWTAPGPCTRSRHWTAHDHLVALQMAWTASVHSSPAARAWPQGSLTGVAETACLHVGAFSCPPVCMWSGKGGTRSTSALGIANSRLKVLSCNAWLGCSGLSSASRPAVQSHESCYLCHRHNTRITCYDDARAATRARGQERPERLPQQTHGRRRVVARRQHLSLQAQEAIRSRSAKAVPLAEAQEVLAERAQRQPRARARVQRGV